MDQKTSFYGVSSVPMFYWADTGNGAHFLGDHFSMQQLKAEVADLKRQLDHNNNSQRMISSGIQVTMPNNDQELIVFSQALAEYRARAHPQATPPNVVKQLKARWVKRAKEYARQNAVKINVQRPAGVRHMVECRV